MPLPSTLYWRLNDPSQRAQTLELLRLTRLATSSIAEAAERLGVSERTLFRLAQTDRSAREALALAKSA
jgi:predicted DNA-binding protein (UPF0251 family)